MIFAECQVRRFQCIINIQGFRIVWRQVGGIEVAFVEDANVCLRIERLVNISNCNYTNLSPHTSICCMDTFVRTLNIARLFWNKMSKFVRKVFIPVQNYRNPIQLVNWLRFGRQIPILQSIKINVHFIVRFDCT